VRLIAEAIGALSFVLYEGAHPRLDLLPRPNPCQEGASFLDNIAIHLLLASSGYVEAVSLEGEGGAQGTPQRCELYSLRPDRMKVVPGPDGRSLAYEYTVMGSSMDLAAALGRCITRTQTG